MLLIICCKFYSYTLKYKSSPTRIGNGTTMDAIRNEVLTWKPTGGKFHLEKGKQLINRLNKLHWQGMQ